MNDYFIELKNGNCSIKTYRPCDAIVTTFDDLVRCHQKKSKEHLIASLPDDKNLETLQDELNEIE